MRSLALGKAFTNVLWLSILCACATSAWSKSCIAKSVVVVGAGMSGSTAAYKIMKKKPKCFKVRHANIQRFSPPFSRTHLVGRIENVTQRFCQMPFISLECSRRYSTWFPLVLIFMASYIKTMFTCGTLRRLLRILPFSR